MNNPASTLLQNMFNLRCTVTHTSRVLDRRFYLALLCLLIILVLVIIHFHFWLQIGGTPCLPHFAVYLLQHYSSSSFGCCSGFLYVHLLDNPSDIKILIIIIIVLEEEMAFPQTGGTLAFTINTFGPSAGCVPRSRLQDLYLSFMSFTSTWTCRSRTSPKSCCSLST